MSDSSPPKVFISYSHKDSDALERLKVHLTPQERAGLVDRWDDTRIQSGQDWNVEIKRALDAANIAVLIVSADFLASDYIHKNELPPLLDAAEKEGLIVMSVILKPCRFTQTASLAQYQSVNPPDRPWSALNAHEREMLWLKVTEDIDKALARPHRPTRASSSSTKPWNVPPYNPFFTGRDDILDQVRNELISSGRAILNGLPGIGKTQAAIAYAHRHHVDYSHAFFVRADSEANLIAGFGEIASLLGLAGRDSQDQNVTVAAVQRWLTENTEWLLIADNADDLPLARRFLPSDNRHGHLLLTSRESATLSFAPPTKLLPMQADTGVRLLLQRAGRLPKSASLREVPSDHLNVARELIRELGGLPLAIEQAGAYMEEMAQTPVEYLGLYKKEETARRLRAWQSSVSAREHESVAVTFNLAFEKVANINPAGAELLQLCAYLAADNIPEFIFTNAAAELGDLLGTAVADDFQRAATIRAATRFSLIHRNSAAKSLSIHRQVQAVICDRLVEHAHERWRELAVRALANVFPDSLEFANWPLCEILLPHALLCVASITERGLRFSSAATLLQRAGNYLTFRARYAEAEPLYDRALQIQEELVGTEHAYTASVLNDLASLHQKGGQFSKAEPLILRAFAIRKKVLGPEHPDTAITLGNLATLRLEQGKLDEAELLQTQALTIREKILGPEHPATAASLTNLATVYQKQSKLSEAEPLYNRALAIREKVLGSSHPDTAVTIGNLAALYQAQGRMGEAEMLQLRALAIRESVLGLEHPDTAASLSNLGVIYFYRKLPGKAEPIFRRALSILEKTLGPTHPKVADTLESIVNLLTQTGCAYSAKPLIARIKAIRREAARRPSR